MKALRRGRERRGWTMTAAARNTGVSRPMISLLEAGLRRPSESLAECLIAAYRLTGAEADAVREISIEWVGRDSPYRTGVSPAPAAWDTFRDTQGNELRRHGATAQHRTDSGTDGAAGRPAATAEDWIRWAKAKTEAQGTRRAVPG